MIKNTDPKQALVKTVVSGSVILPTDLRIGNLIKVETAQSNSYYTNVIKLYQNNILVKEDKEKGVLIRIKPIKLTEEWLLKFGFILYGKEATDSTSPTDWYFIKKGFRFQIDCISHLNSVLGIKIETVHRLQNLYFALTGSDLQDSSLTDR